MNSQEFILSSSFIAFIRSSFDTISFGNSFSIVSLNDFDFILTVGLLFM